MQPLSSRIDNIKMEQGQRKLGNKMTELWFSLVLVIPWFSYNLTYSNLFLGPTCSGESPRSSTVALIQGFMNFPWPLLCWVEVAWHAVLLGIHVHLQVRQNEEKECLVHESKVCIQFVYDFSVCLAVGLNLFLNLVLPLGTLSCCLKWLVLEVHHISLHSLI